MAVRGIDEREEKKSYGSIFVLGSVILVVLTLWSFWDDNITRRPWKAFQARFYRLDYQKATLAYNEEDKKLQAEPAYQELTKKIAAVQTSLAKGETRKKLESLTQEETQAKVRFAELDQEIKFFKSELEEAWYDHDYAVQTGGNPKPALARIQALNKDKAKLDPDLEKAQQRRDQLTDQIDKLNGSVKGLEDQLKKATAERRKWIRVMENASSTVKISELKLISFYKIPNIKQVTLPEFDRNNFDEPVARVDHCQSCHVGINRPGFEKEPQPFRAHPNREVLLADNAHPPEKFGCTACHEGQGAAVNSVKQAHGEVPYWETPLLRGAKVQSSCVSCHLDVQSLKDAALLAQGQRLFEQIGCTGCHLVKGYENIPKIGPSLMRISAKVDSSWMVGWIENPHRFRPRTRMPSLRLSDQEALAITAYLSTLGSKPEPIAKIDGRLQDPKNIARGESLVRKYGCFGCHDIPGMEKESRIGVELTTFGAKTLEELFFGNHTDIKETWDDWIYNKLKTPRTYATERVEQIMPQFDLADEDIKALRFVLVGIRDRRILTRYLADHGARTIQVADGRRLMHQYNCIGCHEIEGRGGFIRKYYQESPTFAPPILNGEGEKVQSPWLFSFLKAPVPIRPWLKLRMPTFGFSDQDDHMLVAFFNGLSKVDSPYAHFEDAKVPQENLEAARKLVSKDYFNCFSCHQQGEKKPEGQEEGWAPDLTLARQRLSPQWIVKWLRDPQKVQPGTKMPSFYPGGPDDVLGGKEDLQIEALRDYIMTFGRGAGTVSAPTPAPATKTKVAKR